MSAHTRPLRTAAARAATLAEQVDSFFTELVKSAPGVVHIEPCGGGAIGTHSFRVYVRDSDPDAERAVYQAKGSVYDRYPEAALEVEVLEESDLGQTSPEGKPETR